MSLRLSLTTRALRLRSSSSGSPSDYDQVTAQKRPDLPPPPWLRRRYHVRTATAAGQDVVTVRPHALRADAPRVIYLHGGAFIAPMGRMHWLLISALLRRTPAAVTVPLYALAPQHDMDDAYRLLDAVTARLEDRPPAGPVVYAGDSAGATLALTYALRQRDQAARGEAAAKPPAALVLFSPGADLTMTNPAIAAIEPRDPVLTSAQVRTVGQWWSGGRPLADPAVSPLLADLSGLAPVHLFAGDQEVLFPDIALMHEKITQAGGTSTLTVARGGFHDYPVALWTPESRQALDQAAAAVENLQ